MLFNNDGVFEPTPKNTKDSVVSAVLVSLFSWRDQWFYRSMGTVLYKAHRAKITNDALSEFEYSARRSLEWLTNDEVAKSYIVKITSKGFDTARIDVDIIMPNDELKYVSVDV